MAVDKSYPVKKEVGKVGEDSPLFIVPLDSAENKSNIANFFAKPGSPAKSRVKTELIEKKGVDKKAGKDINSETHAPVKRKLDEVTTEEEIQEEPATAKQKVEGTVGQLPVKTAQRKPTKRTPPVVKKTPVRKDSRVKITSFFGTKSECH
jgi:hypothetical protein